MCRKKKQFRGTYLRSTKQSKGSLREVRGCEKFDLLKKNREEIELNMELENG